MANPDKWDDWGEDAEAEKKDLRSTPWRDWVTTLILASACAAVLSLITPYRLSRVLQPEVFIAVALAFALFPPDGHRFSLAGVRRAGLIGAVAWVAAMAHSLTLSLFAVRI